MWRTKFVDSSNEQIIIFFCESCHLNSSFEPSKETYYDTSKSWQEFTENYRMLHLCSKNELLKTAEKRLEEVVSL